MPQIMDKEAHFCSYLAMIVEGKKKSQCCCQQNPAVILQSQLLRNSLLLYQKIHVWSDHSQNVCLAFLHCSHLWLVFMTTFAQLWGPSVLPNMSFSS